ncbi:MAG: elongation factor Ts [Lachnospiraceae bacterium]|nr:elongation factor Ts [Lachnospiraceae bacterium]
MAEVTTAMVKQLRDMTGAGVLACKNALVENNGDIDAAVEALRKKGEATAVKKAGRIAAEGIVMLEVQDDKKAAIVEVNSETDFVAKNEKFQTFVKDVLDQVLSTEVINNEELFADKWHVDESKTVRDAVVSMVATIGENINIRRFARIESDGVVVGYVHGGGRIGVLVEAAAENNDNVKEALKNIAMQVAAMNPQYISDREMSEEEVVKLREITVDSALNTPETLPKPILTSLLETAVNEKLLSPEDIEIYGEQKNNLNYIFNFFSGEAKTIVGELAMRKKDEIVGNKIFNGLVDGRFNKQLKDICLLDQVYVRAEDGKQTVAKYLESVDKNLTVTRIVRFEVGEGIEKKKENFAEEVAKQMA